MWCFRYSTLVGIISKKFMNKRKINEEPEEVIDDGDDDDDDGLITTTGPPKSKAKRKFMKPDDS